MRKSLKHFVAVLVSVAFFMWPMFVVVSCSIPETNRAAPNMIAHDRHLQIAATQPALSPLIDAENAAVREYYDSIESGDQSRFLAAKQDLADAVKAEGWGGK